MKRIAIAMLFLAANLAQAAFPIKYNTATCDVNQVRGKWDSFYWEWAGYETQSNRWWITQGSTSNFLDLDGYNPAFRVSRITSSGQVSYINYNTTNDIVLSESNIYCTVPYTNIPPDQTYLAELWLYEGATTNFARPIAQGTIRTFLSLYADDPSLYPFPSQGTNMGAYLTITSAVAVYMQIADYDTNGNNIVDTSDAFRTWTNSGAAHLSLNNRWAEDRTNFFHEISVDVLSGEPGSIVTLDADEQIPTTNLFTLVSTTGDVVLTSTPSLATNYDQPRFLLVQNVGTNSLEIQDRTNLAGTAFEHGGDDLTLNPSARVIFYYNPSTRLWYTATEPCDCDVTVDSLAFEVQNVSGGTLAKGAPVAFAGNSGANTKVTGADSVTNYPCIGAMAEAVNNNKKGLVVTRGRILKYDASGWSLSNRLYISVTPGVFTNVQPTATNEQIQGVATVIRGGTQGGLLIDGAGRVNQIPNLLPAFTMGGIISGAKRGITNLGYLAVDSIANADGQPVINPLSQTLLTALAYTNNLVSNSEFGTDLSSWTTTNNVRHSGLYSGSAQFSNTAVLAQGVATVSGTTYRVEYQAHSAVAGTTFDVKLGTLAVSNFTMSVAGTWTNDVVAPSNNALFRFEWTAPTGALLYMDNLYVYATATQMWSAPGTAMLDDHIVNRGTMVDYVTNAIASHGLTLVVRCGDWEGEEVGAGSTASNAVGWDGYSTANATNNSRSGDAWYSAELLRQDKYHYCLVGIAPEVENIGASGVVFQVRSSTTNPIHAKIDALFGDTQNVTSINDMVSSAADEWKTYQLAGAELWSTDWTSAVPSWTEDGLVIRGLDVRLDVFCSNSNNIQCRMFLHEERR